MRLRPAARGARRAGRHPPRAGEHDLLARRRRGGRRARARSRGASPTGSRWCSPGPRWTTSSERCSAISSRASRSRSESPWSNRTGLGVAAGLGFEISLRPGLTIAGVSVDRVDLALRLDSGEAPEVALRAVAAISGALGPVSFAADAFGVELPIRFVDGNVGPLDISFAVVLPNGLGIGVDVAGVISGGGFLDIDAEAGRYAGIAELELLGVGIVATGILDTKIPGAPKAWSLFLSLAARFTGIQLGFGFTLNGVGGLVGIDRGLDDDALGEAVRSGSLDQILFAREPDCRRGADPRRDRRGVPHGGRAVRVRPDREDRLGHPDADRARRGRGHPAPGAVVDHAARGAQRRAAARGSADPRAARELRRHVEHHGGHAQGGRLAQRLAGRRLPHHGGHGGARGVHRRPGLPGLVRRLPSPVRGAGRLPGSRSRGRRARHRRGAASHASAGTSRSPRTPSSSARARSSGPGSRASRSRAARASTRSSTSTRSRSPFACGSGSPSSRQARSCLACCSRAGSAGPTRGGSAASRSSGCWGSRSASRSTRASASWPTRARPRRRTRRSWSATRSTSTTPGRPSALRATIRSWSPTRAPGPRCTRRDGCR